MAVTAPDNRFSIFAASSKGWRFIAAEWRYLLRAAALPLTAHLVCNLFTAFGLPDATTIEAFLLGLPATVLFAWFVFIETRLLVLGERRDQLPRDPVFLADRARSMRVSILLMLLFNMGVTASAAALQGFQPESGAAPSGDNSLTLGLVVFMLVILVWCLRFGVLPMLAAVDYPLASFLRRVHGWAISFRFMALGLVAVFPLFILTSFLLGAIINDGENMTAVDRLFLVLIDTPLSLVMTVVMTAVMTFALKEMLGKD